MKYIKVLFQKSGIAYQEVQNGNVLRYLNETGNELEDYPPIGDNCKVTSTNPEIQGWMTPDTFFEPEVPLILTDTVKNLVYASVTDADLKAEILKKNPTAVIVL